MFIKFYNFAKKRENKLFRIILIIIVIIIIKCLFNEQIKALTNIKINFVFNKMAFLSQDILISINN